MEDILEILQRGGAAGTKTFPNDPGKILVTTGGETLAEKIG